MPTSQQAVWDPLVRLLHWTLLSAVAIAWCSTLHIGVPSRWHEPAGYTAMACLAIRLVWGLPWRFASSRHARFADFVAGPITTARYAAQVLRGQAPRYLGHNPLGGWMVLALLACIGALTGTGWLQTTDRYWGSELLETVHTTLAWSLLGLVGLHVAGVVFTSHAHRENLVRAMFTGRKPAASGDDVD
jgi:cytochrome b